MQMQAGEQALGHAKNVATPTAAAVDDIVAIAQAAVAVGQEAVRLAADAERQAVDAGCMARLSAAACDQRKCEAAAFTKYAAESQKQAEALVLQAAQLKANLPSGMFEVWTREARANATCVEKILFLGHFTWTIIQKQ